MLYKYRNCIDDDGNRNAYIEGIIKDGAMFFAVPSSFEDVHDCEVNVELHATNAQIRKYWKEELFHIDPNFENALHQNHWWGEPQKFAKFFNSIQKQKKNCIGILGKEIRRNKDADILGIHCLCKNPLKKEMWDKYAYNEGLCIGYRTEPDQNGYPLIAFKEDIFYYNSLEHFLPFIGVDYKDTGHTTINRLPTDQFKKKLQKAILTKEDCWSFEEECRSIVFKDNLRRSLPEKGIALHCADDVIKEIIFAKETSVETIDWVMSLLDSRPCGRNGVKFYRYNGKDGAIPI